MSTSVTPNPLLSALGRSPALARQFASDLQQLNHSANGTTTATAQQDLVTLSPEAIQQAASTPPSPASQLTEALLSGIASASSSRPPFFDVLNQLNSDLMKGNLAAVHTDLLNLDSALQNSAIDSNATTEPVAQAKSNQLIQAFVQALQAGHESAAGAALAHLASMASTSVGANLLTQISQSYGSDSYGSSGSSPYGQLLQSFGSSTSRHMASILDILA